MSLFVRFSVAGLLLATLLISKAGWTDPLSAPSGNQVTALYNCIKRVANDYSQRSRTSCSVTNWLQVCNTCSLRVKKRYAPPDFHKFDVSTAGTSKDLCDNKCETYLNNPTPDGFECEWEAGGGGAGKTGGEVRGTCSITAYYVAQPSDMEVIKSFCLAEVFNGDTSHIPQPKPTPCKLKTGG